MWKKPRISRTFLWMSFFSGWECLNSGWCGPRFAPRRNRLGSDLELTVSFGQLMIAKALVWAYCFFDLRPRRYGNKFCILTHKAGWKGHVCANLPINFDNSLRENFLGFDPCDSVLESVSQHDNERQWFSELVWTWRWTWSKNTSQFVQHPWFRCSQTLQVLLWTAWL